MFLLGYDIGSSSIKVALVNADTQEVVEIVKYPSVEMDILAKQPGWAEQKPEVWWENLCLATKKLFNSVDKIGSSDIQGIGISYQMHGLVLIDDAQKILRPSIIWCDSRAVDIGNNAFEGIGEDKCLNHLLNSPGNFTASKLKWVKDNEPEIYEKTNKFLLPGDYIAMKLTSEVATTIQGLSEATLWDFHTNQPAKFLLDYYGIDSELIPNVTTAFHAGGVLTKSAASELGLSPGIPVSYRSGDQPNNAMSLGVLRPGEIAATGGTSGVVYGIVDKKIGDKQSRVNSFAHVNYTFDQARIGILLCINGAGIQYGWIKNQLASEKLNYSDMERLSSFIPVNSDGLRVIPFGNGSERMLGNKNIGSHVFNLQLNKHTNAHFFRAALEGIAFSFVYGMKMMNGLGLNMEILKVGNDNLFQSEIFSTTICSLLDVEIEVVETTGAVGAAVASGISTGIYSTLESAFEHQKIIKKYTSKGPTQEYKDGYQKWVGDLEVLLHNHN